MGNVRQSLSACVVLIPVAGALLLGLGCARNGAQAGPARAVIERVNGPYLEAGTAFNAELERPVGIGISKAGDPFAARVTIALEAATGEVVIPAGARVVGRVTWVDGGSDAVGIKLDTIETVRGPATLHATIERIGDLAYSVLTTNHSIGRPSYDVLLRFSATAIGGGPPSEPDAVTESLTSSPTVAASARLVLLDRIIPPGVSVERPREELEPGR
jgi:hypothetical protein